MSPFNQPGVTSTREEPKNHLSSGAGVGRSHHPVGGDARGEPGVERVAGETGLRPADEQVRVVEVQARVSTRSRRPRHHPGALIAEHVAPMTSRPLLP